MPAKFNWGLLSTARINNAILAGMPQSERGQVLGVASRDLARAQAYAEAHGLSRAYGSYDEMLADPEIHIVYNALPNTLHAEWTIKALQAGKHVLCEKPFALTVPEVDAMFAAARDNQRVAAEAFMYRHHPKTLKLKELVDSEIGEPRLLLTSFSFNLDRPNDVRWSPELGGGVLWDVGCYQVSLAQYLFGPPERVEVWRKLAPSGVTETIIGTLHHANDRLTQFNCSFRMPFRSHAQVVGSGGVIESERTFQPSTTGASLSLRHGDREEFIELANPAMYWLEIEDMHDAILTGAPTRVTPAETRGHVETLVKLAEK